jgi:hypothetical protein
MVFEDGVIQADFDGKRFFVPDHRRDASIGDLMKWQFGNRRAKWPARVANQPQPPPPQQRVNGDDLCATWIGHSTMLVQVAGVNILTDPFLSERASPVSFAGPRELLAAALADRMIAPDRFLAPEVGQMVDIP